MDESTSRSLRATLAGGYLLFLVSILAAIGSPAARYELSIYGGTPSLFWIAIGLAFLLALVVSVRAAAWSRRGGLLLIGLSALAVTALPILRGYYYAGTGDALSHLGWSKELGAGVLDPTGFLYPGSHTIVVFLHDVAGIEYHLAAQLVVIAFVAVYLFAFPACVRLLTDARHAALIGLLTAVVWMPVNAVSVHRTFHPFSLGVFFLPFVLYLALAYVVRIDQRDGSPVDARAGSLSPLGGRGVLLALAVVALTFVHPQTALLLVVLLATTAAVQFALRRAGSGHPSAGDRAMYGQALFAGGFLALWIANFERPDRVIASTFQGLLGGVPSPAVAQRSASLTELGGSILVLFAKLFLPSVVFIALVGAYLFVKWRRTGGPSFAVRDDGLFAGEDDRVFYVALWGLPLGGIFLVAFAANVTTQHFRYLGGAMLIVAVLGAVAIASFLRTGAPSSGLSRRTIATLAVLVLLVPLGTLTLYSSPYIYQPSGHVTETQLTGYEATIDHRAADTEVTGIREKYFRYMDAILGTEQTRETRYESSAGVPGPVFDSNLSTYYDDPRYLPVTRLDYEREVTLYEGFRYSDAGFRNLNADPDIYRVQSTGEYTMYVVTGNETAAA